MYNNGAREILFSNGTRKEISADCQPIGATFFIHLSFLMTGRERVYNNGAREILFSNGTRKEISADSQPMVVSFFIRLSFFMSGRKSV